MLRPRNDVVSTFCYLGMFGLHSFTLRLLQYTAVSCWLSRVYGWVVGCGSITSTFRSFIAYAYLRAWNSCTMQS